ncbi:GIY-YIG nuclease family protein [Neobacillus drentensis]|uniref:GIY-YIG nuclease family protein n=1 Tax=Neobacillus drentensis TaxID=220684 RepID=UPI001F3B69F9|nr:GIY-YIG nuclease family protein [Neobacillus drentensis]ULT55869.1 GIY-YIG nuclease family protein [Neobacillus drentensis]
MFKDIASLTFEIKDLTRTLDRESILTSSFFIKDITEKIPVWQIDETVDFSDIPGCYVFRDKYGKVVYVGQTKSFWKRFSQHMITKKTNTTSVKVTNNKKVVKIIRLYQYFHTVEFYQLDVNDADLRFILEQFLFLKFKPPHNIYTQRMISGEEYIQKMESYTKREKWSDEEKGYMYDAIRNWYPTTDKGLEDEEFI